MRACNKAPKRSEHFSPLGECFSPPGLVCIFLLLGRVTLMTASLRELHSGKCAVAFLLLPVEQKEEQKCHISNIQKYVQPFS